MRSRRVSGVVLEATLDVPAPPQRLVADWERDIASGLALEAGDVEPLQLARTRARWPGDNGYRRCVQAMADWTSSLGMPGVLAASDIALMACRGARYHHDGATYGGAAFCNLFLCDDKGLDLHFCAIDLRIPLVRGTAVVFDTGQPHAVIRRAAKGFDTADFAAGRDVSLAFLTWELPIEQVHVARTLGIEFDVDAATAASLDEEQLRRKGERLVVCPDSGRWCAA
jgi:hypothetical protein